MRCPFCVEVDTRVVDSRIMDVGDKIRRRRECQGCGERFTTYEVAELNFPRIVKRDGRRESFSGDKLRDGILRAIEKRPISIEQVEIIIAQVQRKLRTEGKREVNSGILGNWAMEQLRTLDQVAYIRFASVYCRFEDLHAFLSEIEQLENDMPPELKKSQLNLLRSQRNEN